MGICWASPSNNPSPVSTRQFSSKAISIFAHGLCVLYLLYVHFSSRPSSRLFLCFHLLLALHDSHPCLYLGISQTTNNTTSSDETNISGNSQFSAASGSDEIYPNGQILPTPNLRIFSFAELKNATRNFRTDTVLGEGGFGKVYKGWLEEKVISKNGSGSVVAVKKLNSESMQGFQEWQRVDKSEAWKAILLLSCGKDYHQCCMGDDRIQRGPPTYGSEVNFLGRLSHPNLVKLLGYCWEDKELLLVYEFMQKGSLENHLFGRGSAVQPLPWDIRLKILIGAAQGLAFLHTSDKQVIYRDFKASNILLDGSYNAKISDFGLAKLGPSASQSHVTTRVMGTSGYAAPEYVATGHLYVKSDVYGFGVVLVEMLTSLRAVDQNRPSGQHNLVDWVKPYLTDRRKLKNIMDSRLEGKYPSKAALQIAQLALNCLGTEPKTRPSMKEVLQTLERIDAGNEKPKEPRINSTRHTANRRGQQRLHHRSPLHPWQDGNQSYQLPPRSS
ncbi:unnamed protein product [Camellia sinensis]